LELAREPNRRGEVERKVGELLAPRGCAQILFAAMKELIATTMLNNENNEIIDFFIIERLPQLFGYGGEIHLGEAVA
jgi:hypothetical protein